MEYVIEIYVWNLGYDEADELVEALTKALESRGLGTDPESQTAAVRSVVTLKPQGMEKMNASTRPGLKRVLQRATRGARLVAIPGIDYRKRREDL